MKKLMGILVFFIALAITDWTLGASSGTMGEYGNIKWTLDDQGTLTITGWGIMPSLSTEPPSSWRSEKDKIRVVNIGEGITRIGSDAFRDCDNLIDVTIPDSVKTMGTNVFCSCTSLRSITLPGSLESTGYFTFAGCTSLTDVTLNEGISVIGACTFIGCSSLTQITIPNSVTTIEDGAFEECKNLPEITIPENVNCIEVDAFAGCSSLKSVTIPKSVTRIGKRAFSYCSSLTNITIPASVTSIGSSALARCFNLRRIYVVEDSYAYQWAISEGYGGIIKLVKEEITYSLTNGVAVGKEIDIAYGLYNPDESQVINKLSYQFLDNGYIRYTLQYTVQPGLSLTVFDPPDGDTLWYQEANVMTSPGNGTLKFDVSLEKIKTIPFISISFVDFTSPDDDWVLGVSFEPKRRWLTLPSNTSIVESEAFEGNNECEVIVLPEGCRKIGYRAFADCPNLEYVLVSRSTVIDEHAFDGCDGLMISYIN